MTVIEDIYRQAGVQLVKKSDKYWVAPCPFGTHADKTPSFVVYRDGAYKCFGCGKSGPLSDWGGTDTAILSRIDVAQVEDDFSRVAEYFFKQAEKWLPQKRGSFALYDLLDKMAIDIRLESKNWSRIELALFIKQQLAKILSEVEEKDGLRNASEAHARWAASKVHFRGNCGAGVRNQIRESYPNSVYVTAEGKGAGIGHRGRGGSGP